MVPSHMLPQSRAYRPALRVRPFVKRGRSRGQRYCYQRALIMRLKESKESTYFIYSRVFSSLNMVIRAS